MKRTVNLIAVVLCAVFMLAAASCSKRKPVELITTNSSQPTTKKDIGYENTSPDSTDSVTTNTGEITVEFGEEAFILKTPDSEYKIKYDKISEIAYMSSWEYETDTLTSGNESASAIYGDMTTSDDEQYEYKLFIYKPISVYISVSYGGEQYVFNLESKEATKKCYDSIKEKMN